MSARPVSALRAHLFSPAPARRLAMLRIVVAAWTLHYVGRRRRMLARVARTDPSLFQPVGPARALRRPLGPASFSVLYATTLATNIAVVAGFKHRCSGPVFGGSLLCLLSYRNSWSMIYHNDNALVLHALTLGLSPAADVWSLDARSRMRPRCDEADWRYGWPIQLMSGLTAFTYFLAGVAKIKGPLGFAWASGEALRSQVAVDAMRKEVLGGKPAAMGARLYERVAIYRVLAVGSLAIELGAPLTLMNRRLARVWAINAFLMHWGIYILMGISFRYQLAGVMFASFFEPERVVPGVARR